MTTTAAAVVATLNDARAAPTAAELRRATAAQQRRRYLENQERSLREADAAKVRKWALQFDKNCTDRLERSEVASLLERRIRARPDDKAVEYIMQCLGRFASDEDHTLGVPLEAALSVVERYGDYVAEQERLDQLLDTYAEGASQTIQPKSMLQLLRDTAQSTSTRISMGDVEFVLSTCDKDGDGAIARAELGPALATWKRLLRQRESKERVAAVQAELSEWSRQRRADSRWCACAVC